MSLQKNVAKYLLTQHLSLGSGHFGFCGIAFWGSAATLSFKNSAIHRLPQLYPILQPIPVRVLLKLYPQTVA